MGYKHHCNGLIYNNCSRDPFLHSLLSTYKLRAQVNSYGFGDASYQLVAYRAAGDSVHRSKCNRQSAHRHLCHLGVSCC